MKAKGTNQMDRLHQQVIRRYHTLCNLLNLTDEDRLALLSPYGCASSVDMETRDLLDVCGALSRELDKRTEGVAIDKLRKRVMAAIGGWLTLEGKQSSIALIKAIACRATGYRSFNKIPRERLRNLIRLFNNKTKDAKRVEELRALMELTPGNHQLAN